MGILLFLRTRHALAVGAICLATALTIFFLAGFATPLLPFSQFVVAVGLLLPCVPAIALGSSVMTEAAAREAGAMRVMAGWRVAFMCLLSIFAFVVLATASGTSAGPAGMWLSVCRNFLAFTGVSLITACVIGQPFAWVPCFLSIAVPALVFPTPEADRAGLATFFSQPTTSATTMALAVGCFVCGGALSASPLQTTPLIQRVKLLFPARGA